jgi:S-adenosylhomocysteine hydrolase
MYWSRITQSPFHLPPLKPPPSNFFRSPSFYSKSTRFFSSRSEEIIPQLPLLTEFATLARNQGLASQEKTLLIGVQHMLPTTASLFNTCIESLGIKPEHMWFTGKFYSSCNFVEQAIRDRGIHLIPSKIPKKPCQFTETIDQTMNDMWVEIEGFLEKSDINRIIILDEGGHCRKRMPKWIAYHYLCVSIEQTRFGFYNAPHGLYPLIDVARSAAKRKIESRLINAAIVKRVAQLIKDLELNPKTVFGVVGNGALGSDLARFLLSENYTVLVQDENVSAFQNISTPKCYRINTVADLINSADIVLGCTGKDITKKTKLSDIKSPVILISCSSQEIEFQSLIEKISKQNFSLVKTENFSYMQFFNRSGTEINIVENGYPINFTRQPSSDPVKDMLLTRLLLTGGIIQAATIKKTLINDGITPNKGNNIHMLHPAIQQWIVKHWQHLQPRGRYTAQELEYFNDRAWIKGNSEGEYHTEDFLEKTFSDALSSSTQTKFPFSK